LRGIASSFSTCQEIKAKEFFSKELLEETSTQNIAEKLYDVKIEFGSYMCVCVCVYVYKIKNSKKSTFLEKERNIRAERN
jgi:hypothetical protein